MQDFRGFILALGKGLEKIWKSQSCTILSICAKHRVHSSPGCLFLYFSSSLNLCSSLNHALSVSHPGTTWTWLATTLNPHYEGNDLGYMINDDRFLLSNQRVLQIYVPQSWFYLTGLSWAVLTTGSSVVSPARLFCPFLSLALASLFF